MEQNQGFWQKYWYYLLVVAVVVLVIVLIASQRGPDENDAQEEQTNTQNEGKQGQNQNGSVNGGQTSANGATVTGSVTARGTLRTSDDTSKGNLMIESDQGKVYIQTARDFSALLDKDVTLNAEGTLQSFTFLGLAETGATAADDTATGGPAPEEQGEVRESGRLEASDDAARGNYQIITADTKIYLQSVRDYSAWIGTDVELSASGTIESFINAKLTRK